MLKLAFRRIKPECEERLRRWFAELESRRAEVLETLVGERVRHEQAFVLETSDGPVLVWAAELDDPEHAAATFAQSPHAIDREHARVLRECLDQTPPVTRVFDVAVAP
ncbi:MAG TPA: DUF6176 family protein [Polyangiaceae bacterium]|nr:DUF6176 family protein [Polyangiaceae bacterium]